MAKVNLAILMIILSAPAQTRTAEGNYPSFEALSVKPSGTNENRVYGPSAPVQSPVFGFRFSGQHVSCNQELRAIIREAYSVREFQIAGPDWIYTNTYRVDALMPAGASKDDARLMLRRMLDERFGFRYHRVQRDVPVYALTEAKGGSTLKPAATPEQLKQRTIETPMGPVRGIRSAQGRGAYTALGISVAEFADWLSHQMDRPVNDATRIDGQFEIELKWTPDEGVQQGQYDGELIRAIERNLGLKLEKRNQPYEFLVIDRVDKTPTGN